MKARVIVHSSALRLEDVTTRTFSHVWYETKMQINTNLVHVLNFIWIFWYRCDSSSPIYTVVVQHLMSVPFRRITLSPKFNPRRDERREILRISQIPRNFLSYYTSFALPSLVHHFCMYMRIRHSAFFDFAGVPASRLSTVFVEDPRPVTLFWTIRVPLWKQKNIRISFEYGNENFIRLEDLSTNPSIYENNIFSMINSQRGRDDFLNVHKYFKLLWEKLCQKIKYLFFTFPYKSSS